MLKVALEFTYHTDIIMIPDEIGTKIKKYQNLFDKWIYDKSNNHGHWIYQGKQKMAVSFDTNTFVEYLNEVHLKDKMEKAIIYKECAEHIAEDIPHIYF